MGPILMLMLRDTLPAESGRRHPHAEMTTGERAAWDAALRTALAACRDEQRQGASLAAFAAGAEACADRIVGLLATGPGGPSL